MVNEPSPVVIIGQLQSPKQLNPTHISHAHLASPAIGLLFVEEQRESFEVGEIDFTSAE